MFALRGNGVKAARSNLCFEKRCQLSALGSIVECKIRVVSSYKHMGAVVSARGEMSGEVDCRISSMKTHYIPAKKRVYANRGLAKQVRHDLFNSLCLTRLLYN